MELPKSWPIPDHLPKPLTMRAHAEEGANILERGEIDRGNLMTAQVIMARATGADPKVLAAVLRGAMAEPISPEALRKVGVQVLVLNGKADVANQAIGRLLEVIPNVRPGACEGDHGSTPFQPSFQQAVIDFLESGGKHEGSREVELSPEAASNKRFDRSPGITVRMLQSAPLASGQP